MVHSGVSGAYKDGPGEIDITEHNFIFSAVQNPKSVSEPLFAMLFLFLVIFFGLIIRDEDPTVRPSIPV